MNIFIISFFIFLITFVVFKVVLKSTLNDFITNYTSSEIDKIDINVYIDKEIPPIGFIDKIKNNLVKGRLKTLLANNINTFFDKSSNYTVVTDINKDPDYVNNLPLINNLINKKYKNDYKYLFLLVVLLFSLKNVYYSVIIIVAQVITLSLIGQYLPIKPSIHIKRLTTLLTKLVNV